MGLKEIRNARELSQRELAAQSGVNFRTLQDYEQGRKKLTSASGDVLLRLSTVLGCSICDLLVPEPMNGAKLDEQNLVSPDVIQAQKLYCSKYNTSGRWICHDGMLSILFYFEGIAFSVPFEARFTPESLPALRESAALQIEAKIQSLFDKQLDFVRWW